MLGQWLPLDTIHIFKWGVCKRDSVCPSCSVACIGRVVQSVSIPHHACGGIEALYQPNFVHIRDFPYVQGITRRKIV
jgi:hypothetical protein